MSAVDSGVRRAAVLGSVTGARTFLAPAALALRGRLGKAAQVGLPVLAAGELVGDKLPMTPPRSQGPGLVGRVVSGALSGRVSAGGRGARVGAAFALAATYPSQALRGQIVRRTSIPDIAFAVSEDIVGVGLVAVASEEPRPRPAVASGLGAAGVGVAAAVVGTAAMTSAQQWVYGLTGASASEAPAMVGEKILGALGVKVPKERRPALGTAMHVLYGASWGLPFGLVSGRGERAPGVAQGLVFGANVWAMSLVMLPALGVAEAPWRQPLGALAQDLGFHLVYGAATAAACEPFWDQSRAGVQ
jgi:uncharacterized membrane protein